MCRALNTIRLIHLLHLVSDCRLTFRVRMTISGTKLPVAQWPRAAMNLKRTVAELARVIHRILAIQPAKVQTAGERKLGLCLAVKQKIKPDFQRLNDVGSGLVLSPYDDGKKR